MGNQIIDQLVKGYVHCQRICSVWQPDNLTSLDRNEARVRKSLCCRWKNKATDLPLPFLCSLLLGVTPWSGEATTAGLAAVVRWALPGFIPIDEFADTRGY